MLNKLLSLLFFSIVMHQLVAQNDVVKVVRLDEFVVSAANEGFDVSDFIDRVRNDTTFYKAFLNMKYYPHRIDGDVIVYNKDAESEKGTMFRKAVQKLDRNELAAIDIVFETTNGKIRKRNGEWRYLTAEMYDDVFFPKGHYKANTKINSFDQELVGGTKIEKHKAQLKRMMFNPGAAIGNVPFIGDKMAIFDDHMVPYYDYAIYNASYDGQACLAFSCFTKQGMEEKTVIHDLTSYFDPETYAVLAREYRLAHSTLFFTFDIHIKVENALLDGLLLPKLITYDGFWTVPLRKPEIIQFSINCFDYDTLR